MPWRAGADCRVPVSTAQVQQTQAYCAGRFAEWDEKITTFPGLYALGAGAAWLVRHPLLRFRFRRQRPLGKFDGREDLI